MRIRSLCVDKEAIKIKSGETILNQLYQHKKTQFALSQKGTKSSMNCSLNENGVVNLGEYDEENEYIKNLPFIGSAHVMSNEEEINIRKSLSNHFLFKDITNEVLTLILNELIFFPFPKGRIIYEEGDEGNFFYILASGNVEATVKGKKKKKLFSLGMFWRIKFNIKKKKRRDFKMY